MIDDRQKTKQKQKISGVFIDEVSEKHISDIIQKHRFGKEINHDQNIDHISHHFSAVLQK